MNTTSTDWGGVLSKKTNGMGADKMMLADQITYENRQRLTVDMCVQIGLSRMTGWMPLLLSS